jgi:hypothetical protein
VQSIKTKRLIFYNSSIDIVLISLASSDGNNNTTLSYESSSVINGEIYISCLISTYSGDIIFDGTIELLLIFSFGCLNLYIDKRGEVGVLGFGWYLHSDIYR